jgi:hypothetical protein
MPRSCSSSSQRLAPAEFSAGSERAGPNATVSAFLNLSQVLRERVEPHLNIGADFHVDAVNHSSVLYAAGVTWRAWPSLGLIIDFLGRSDFARFRIRNPAESRFVDATLDSKPDTCTATQPCFLNPNRFLAFTLFPPPLKIRWCPYNV